MEVTIAVSIIAITCIPLIGMLPAGMKTMREGQREAVSAEIVRHLTNELSMSNWNDTNDLADWDGELRYYDKEGVLLETEEGATFTTLIKVQPEAALPGAANNSYLKTVNLKVSDRPAVQTERFTDRRYHRETSLIIARLDK